MHVMYSHTHKRWTCVYVLCICTVNALQKVCEREEREVRERITGYFLFSRGNFHILGLSLSLIRKCRFLSFDLDSEKGKYIQMRIVRLLYLQIHQHSILVG